MPHALTERQAEVLTYVREFIALNERSPRLEAIAAHFGGKAPTAHKDLPALQAKRYSWFKRSPQSGFFILVADHGPTDYGRPIRSGR